MTRFLPTDPRRRAVAVALLWCGGLLLVTQVLLPGPAGIPGRGTPWATMFFGLVQGVTISLTTAGIVLVYRTQRILNFAQTSIGLVGAYFFFGLTYFTALPFPLALVLGIAVAAGAGAVVGAAMLRFLEASRLVLTVVTILGASLLANLSANVYELPFFPEAKNLPVDLATGSRRLAEYLPFAGFDFTIGGLRPGFGFSELLALELAAVTLLALAAFFRFTRAGVAVRAIAENPERASLLGIGVGGLTVLVWTIAGALSGVSTLLTGVLETPSRAGGFAPTLLITAFAAAVVARMDRLPTAVAASVAIAVLSEAFRYSFPADRALVPVLLFLLLAGTLLLQGRRRDRSEVGAAVTWSAVEEQRAIPRELLAVPGVRWARRALIAVGILGLAVVPFAFATSVVLMMGVLYLGAIVTLSVVVLTGWGGQVSLGQWAFAAVGAIVGGALTATVGLPFWIAVPVAAAVTGAFAMLIGLPALRIPGLFLLPVTFAFAAAVQSAFFEERYFGWILPDDLVERPTFFFLDFRNERSMYFLTAACLILALTVVSRLRRTRTGRILIALRENDASVEAFGVPLVRTKLLAFGVSGALSGFAGAVYVHHQQGLNGEVFTAFAGVQAFSGAIFGGIGSSIGAVLGTGFYEFIEYFGVDGLVGTFARNGGPLLIVFAAPAGLISIVNALRDGGLRVIAQRRQIYVPSLFTKQEADDDGRWLVPLSDPETSAGLAALPTEARWSLRSGLYRTRPSAPIAAPPNGHHPTRDSVEVSA